ncbi:fimbria/pilus outer membrane usher protein [Rhodalgimonas zhirmunskyi]|uniref:Fimbria/pilus outer membrane usher protein n=1 Tax=Rhodalgimonas zhirmunskyi TaxID=2964767 RepID=A0AAJ1UAE7_9RHOB|nr:fimbria/pilus outer membrane usher protein [Rhodoalgimonas zhirmunskyi]MDQ2092702.1 fimbria/pilus outer membrane usher protein [Rhodoalgimonas zhirmunskyi]
MHKFIQIPARLLTAAALVVQPSPGFPEGTSPAPATAVLATAVDGVSQNTLDITANVSGADEELVPLVLEVVLNGKPTGLVASFEAQFDGSAMRSTRDELKQIGLRSPLGLSKSVPLAAIDGLKYDYDATAQSVAITVPQSALRPEVISAAYLQEFEAPDRAYGGVLNYSLVGQHGLGTGGGQLSASLDGWVFAPFGTLGSTAFFSKPLQGTGPSRGLRLDTAVTINMPGKALKLTLGDFTTAGPSWARPIRMGGVQLRRDFSLRSDLVTDQRLAYSGAAAVPSTVDVFIENNRVYSTNVDPGPFQLEDIPVTGGGDAQIVVRGLDGQIQRQNVSFFASADLLKKGMADYSLGIGQPRQAYAIRSNDYSNNTSYSATLRYGLTRRITLEGHAAGTDGFHLWGGGVSMVPFALGELSLSAAQSDYRGQQGQTAHLGLSTQIGRMELQASSSRSSAGFTDLAYVTGLDYLGAGAITSTGSLLETALAQDVVSLAIPLGKDNRKLGLSYIRAERANSRDRLASASYGASVAGGRGSLSMNGAWNFEDEDLRLSVGLSWRLGKRTYAQASTYTDSKGRMVQDTSISRTMGEGVQAWGYQVQAGQRDGRVPLRLKGDYRARYGEWSGEVQTDGISRFARVQLDGAVAATSGGVALGTPINDGFAMVDLGVSDVPVYVDNRPVARTNRNGRVLVTGLNAYRSNRVSVNVRDLPEKATLGISAVDLVPSRGAGQYLSFGGNEGGGVLVVLHDPQGRPLPPASAVRSDQGEEAIVGYDGETWIEHPTAQTTLTVTLPSGRCTARFAYAKSSAVQDRIGPVTCQ